VPQPAATTARTSTVQTESLAVMKQW